MKFRKKNKIYVKKDAGNVPYNNEVFNNSTGNMPSMSEAKINRYSDALSDDDRKNGWWYFTTHGVQPGSIPKDLNVLEIKDTENGTFVKLDGILNTSELKKYDMKEKAPKNMNESKRLNNREKKVYIDIIKNADDIEDLEDIVHEIFFYDKGLFTMLRHFPKDMSFEQLRDKFIEIIESTILDENLNEASYGGAYDIEDDMYFTKDDLMEFIDVLIEKLENNFNGHKFDISDAYFNTPTHVVIDLSDESGIEAVYDFKIDMRKIKKPNDLQKYIPQTLDYFVNEYEYWYDDSIDESINEANNDKYRINYDDDLVIVKKGSKVIYKGLEDYEPMKNEPWKFDGKKYTLDGGYTKKLVRESLNEEIDITSYDELSSTLKDGGNNYRLFRKLENGKGKWAAAPIVMGDVKYDDAFEITYEQARGYEPISNIGKLSRQLGKKLLPKNEALNEKLVEAPDSVADELINILNKYGFILDDSVNHENPMRTAIFHNIHVQVINPNSHITMDEDTTAQMRKYVPNELIDEIHELEESSNCPITWNFGINADDKVTAGLDIMEQYIPDDVDEINEDVTFRDEIPYDYNEMEIELKAATNNWTKDKFECWVKFKSEFFDAKDILSHHYEDVEDFGEDEGLYGLYATRPSIYESIDDLTEAVSSKDVMNKLKSAVDDVVDFYMVMDYPYPDGWLGDSWQDLNDGLKMGLDDYVELADNLLELLKNEIKSIEKINGLKDEDPDYDTFIELRDNLKYYYNEYLKSEGYTDLVEDTVKQGNYWVNKGKEGTHGKFKTKKAADAQRRAMFANGYTESYETRNIPQTGINWFDNWYDRLSVDEQKNVEHIINKVFYINNDELSMVDEDTLEKIVDKYSDVFLNEDLNVITEDKDDEYVEATRQADYEANQLRDEYNKGDKSISDILIEMEYEQDDPDSVYFYKEVDGGNAIIFDVEDYDDGKNFIKYFVVDEDDKIKQGFTATKLIIDESLNESNNSYSYENYYVIDFGNCWVAKDSYGNIVCKRETSDEVENWIDEQSGFDECLNENLGFNCPHCHNKELRCIEHEVNIPADVDFHEVFICDECGSEYLSEPQYDGKIKFKTYYESDL